MRALLILVMLVVACGGRSADIIRCETTHPDAVTTVEYCTYEWR